MSIRVASTSLIAGKVVVGVAGHGVLAQLIPSTGDFGPGLAYSSLSFPADNGKEIRVFITTQPTLGKLYVFENTSFIYDGPSDTFQYQVYLDGVALGTPQPGTITIGGASTVSSVTVTPSTATGSTTFAATVAGTGGPSQSVTWTTTAGSINASGVFTAPAATASVQTITITATSVQDATKSGTATATIAASAGGITYIPSLRQFVSPSRTQSFSSPARSGA